MSEYQPIATAPRDGTPVRIKGMRFMSDEGYRAVAVWATRHCPVLAVTGWFPPGDKHDGMGPYEPTHWKSLE